MIKRNHIGRTALFAGSLMGIASTAMAAPNYGLLTTIALPPAITGNPNNPDATFDSFDIGAVDPVTGNYYIADRADASVDIISGTTLKVIGKIGGFAGQQATTSISGPDGIAIADNGTTATLYAGDGGSTAKAFNVTNPAAPTPLFATSTGGAPYRVDEMAVAPASNLLLVANNANSPAFASLINATTGAVIKGNITIPNSPTGGGLEASVWDPKTNTFFVSVPAFNGANDPGGIAEIDTNGNVIATFDFNTVSGGSITSCSPAGIGLGASGNIVVGCGNANTQTVVFNPATGKIVTTIGTVSDTDELWYDPTSQDFYLTGAAANGDRIISVIGDATDTVLQTIDLTLLGAGLVNAHSVAVDPLNGDIFVPLEGNGTSLGNDALCPNGCVAVFAQAVPEPGTLPLLTFALLGMAGAFTYSRKRSS